jgi:dipeptidyl aminopeptidase/acylaminoacyl peptidase
MLAATATGIALPGTLRAQAPVASPATSSSIRLVDVPGIPLALSPDGTMIAGLVDRDRFCIWDSETFEAIAESEPMEEIGIIDELSVSWSPDNSAVAWSLDAARLLRDSDIYVFDVDNGQITNLTDDPPTDMDAPKLPLGAPPADSPAMDVDVQPSWTADGESLVFARTVWGGSPEAGTSLMSIPRGGGDATELATLSPEMPFLVSSIKAGMDDGSVIYATWPPDPDSPDQGLTRTTPSMFLLSVAPNARKASLVSMINYTALDNALGPTWIEMDLDTGIPTAFEEVLSLPTDPQEAARQDLILLGAPAFLTDDTGALTGYLYATTDQDFETHTLWRHDAASGLAESRGTFRRGEEQARLSRQYSRIEVGENGTVVIFHPGNVWVTSTGE